MYNNKPRSSGGRFSSDSRPKHSTEDRSESSQGQQFNDWGFSGSGRRSSGGRSSYGSSRSSSGRSGGSRGGRFARPSRGEDHSKYIKKGRLVEQEAYIPQNKFADFQIEDKLKYNITKRGFETPTPIQDQAIPLILQGRDLIGIANTGTGKTGAFLIPLIDKTLKMRKEGKECQTIIIVPTRELALQIDEELWAFADYLKVFSTCCVGGMDIRKQIFRLRKQNHFIIGTPGRLVDLVDRRLIDLKSIQNIVLDEVDRMLDMGFVDDIKFLVNQLPEDRQTLFFSATLDKSLQPLANTFLRDPVTISVKTGNTSDSVDQDVVRVERHESKIQVLHDLLIKEDFTRVLIFGRTKAGVENLYEELNERGFKTESIHGDKSQGQRQHALRKFKEGKVDILVATDVAARGLDIENVSHVINFEVPDNYEDYIHRIGRTGRGGKLGKALTFVS